MVSEMPNEEIAKNTSLINTIINGDCLHVIKKLHDNSINLIVTSPPYADKRKRYYDSIHPSKYVEWFLPIADELKRVMKEDGSFILNIKEHPKDGERETYVLELILAMKKQGWYWIEEYCWYKKNSFPGKWPNRFRDSWERCLHFSKNKKFKMYQDAVMVPVGEWAEKRFKSMSEKDFTRHLSGTNPELSRNVSNWLERKKVYPHNVLVFEDEHYLFEDREAMGNIPNLIEFATVCYNTNHSAAFPLELPTWFINLLSKEDDVILDPFIGSGTTAVAAKLLGRKYIGIELSQPFVEFSNANLQEVEPFTIR